MRPFEWSYSWIRVVIFWMCGVQSVGSEGSNVRPWWTWISKDSSLDSSGPGSVCLLGQWSMFHRPYTFYWPATTPTTEDKGTSFLYPIPPEKKRYETVELFWIVIILLLLPLFPLFSFIIFFFTQNTAHPTQGQGNQKLKHKGREHSNPTSSNLLLPQGPISKTAQHQTKSLPSLHHSLIAIGPA